MTVDEPYFLSNKEWYYFDEKEWRYKLTDKATKKAIESYEEFYSELEERIEIHKGGFDRDR